MFNPVILKDNPEIPDNYKVKVEFIGGSSKEYEIVGHRINDSFKTLEMFLSDERIVHVPLTSMKEFEFHKDLQKILEIKNKNEQ